MGKGQGSNEIREIFFFLVVVMVTELHTSVETNHAPKTAIFTVCKFCFNTFTLIVISRADHGIAKI